MSKDYTNELLELSADLGNTRTNNIEDSDEKIQIVGRDINMSADTACAVRGDSQSQLLTFEIGRYVDNVDLSTKIISIKYKNALNQCDRAVPHSTVVNDDNIVFTWLIDGRVTAGDGDVTFQIEFYETVDEVLYSWQTKSQKFKVLPTLDIDGSIELPPPTLVQEMQSEVEKVKVLRADIENELEALDDETLNSIKYYGDSNITPTDSSFFNFTTDDETMTATIESYHRLDDTNETVVVPYEIRVNGKDYKVTAIGDRSFEVTDIKNMVLPRTVEKIGVGVFISSYIETIVIPDSVNFIGESAFATSCVTDVYYFGTEEKWNSLIAGKNVSLPDYYTKIHFNFTPAAFESFEYIKENGIETTGSISMNRRADSKIGEGSVTLGTGGVASGEYALAEGYDTEATHWASHTGGTGTKSTSSSSNVRGKYNKVKSNLADVVGNGKSDANRTNAYELDWSGNAYFAGNVESGKEPTKGSHLINKGYLDSKLLKFKSVKLKEGETFTVHPGMIFFFSSSANISGVLHDNNSYSVDTNGLCVGFCTDVGATSDKEDSQYRLHLTYLESGLITPSIGSENLLLDSNKERATITVKAEDMYIWYVEKG